MSLIAVYFPDLIKRLKLPLYRNAMYILLLNSLPGALGMVYWGIASRLYSAEDVGLGSALLSAIVLVSGLAGLGTFAGLIRFLPEVKDPVHFLNSLYTLIIFASVVLGFLSLLAIPLWTWNLKILQTNSSYLIVFLVSIIVTPLSTLVIYTFVAQRCSQYAFLLVVISNLSRLVLVLVFIRQGAEGIVISVTLSWTLSLSILMAVFLPRVVPGYRFRWSWDLRLYKTILPYSVGNYSVTLLAQSTQTVLPILILEVAGPQANGYAFIPLQLSFAVTTAGFSLATSAFAESAHHLRRSQQILTSSSVVGLAISAVLTLITLFGAPVFMGWFGAEYAQESTGLLRLAALAGPFMVLNQNYYTRLRLEKRIRLLNLLSLVCFVLTIGIAFLLMPSHGIEACGVGLLVGHASVSIWILVLVRRGASNFLLGRSRV